MGFFSTIANPPKRWNRRRYKRRGGLRKEYAGCHGAVMSIDTFGVSGPGDQVIEKFGFTVEDVVERFKELV